MIDSAYLLAGDSGGCSSYYSYFSPQSSRVKRQELVNTSSVVSKTAANAEGIGRVLYNVSVKVKI